MNIRIFFYLFTGDMSLIAKGGLFEKGAQTHNLGDLIEAIEVTAIINNRSPVSWTSEVMN